MRIRKAVAIATGAALAASAAAAGAGASLAGAQAASGPQEHIAAKVHPKRAGTRRHPRRGRLSFVASMSYPAGTQPPVVTKAVVWFPKGLEFNGRHFPSCSANTLYDQGPQGCPKGSRIGSGSAEAVAGGLTLDPTITVFNADRGRHIEFYLQLANPSIQMPLDGRISRTHGRYATKLTVRIPEQLQQPVPGLFVSLTRFATTVAAVRGHHHHKVGYVETTSCPRHGWRFEGVFSTSDGKRMRATDTVACRRG